MDMRRARVMTGRDGRQGTTTTYSLSSPRVLDEELVSVVLATGWRVASVQKLG